MWIFQSLSKKGSTETWCFAGIIVLSMVFVAILHRQVSDQEYYTTRQRARIKSEVTNATYLISKGKDVERQMQRLDVLNQLICDQASEKILGFRLSSLFSASSDVFKPPAT